LGWSRGVGGRSGRTGRCESVGHRRADAVADYAANSVHGTPGATAIAQQPISDVGQTRDAIDQGAVGVKDKRIKTHGRRNFPKQLLSRLWSSPVAVSVATASWPCFRLS